ncbi:MAG: hypothetical protein ACYSUX_19345 [Planctomycetota bacterium]
MTATSAGLIRIPPAWRQLQPITRTCGRRLMPYANASSAPAGPSIPIHTLITWNEGTLTFDVRIH